MIIFGREKTVKNSLVFLLLIFLATFKVQANDWWNPNWHYRISFNLPEEIKSKAATYINFAELLDKFGIKGAFDENSIRVIDTKGKEIPSCCENRMDEDPSYVVVWSIQESQGPYSLYFDILANGKKSPPSYPVDAVPSLNLLTNASFEIDNNTDGFPDYWGAQNPEKTDGVFAISKEKSTDGRQSLRVDVTKTQSPWVRMNQYLSPSAAASLPGKTLYFSIDLYMEKGSHGDILLRQWDKEGKSLGSVGMNEWWHVANQVWAEQNVGMKGENGKWIKTKYTGIVKAGTSRIDCYYRQHIPSPEIRDSIYYLDNLRLEIIPDSPLLISINKKEFSSSEKIGITVNIKLRDAILRDIKAAFSTSDFKQEEETFVRVMTDFSGYQLKDLKMMLGLRRKGEQEFRVSKEITELPEVFFDTSIGLEKVPPGNYTLATYLLFRQSGELLGISEIPVILSENLW